MRVKIASIVSEVFSPFILTGILTTTIALATDSRPLIPALVTLVCITLIPQGLSIYLHRSQKTTDRFIMVRQQRTPFYLATLVSIALGALLLNFFISTTTEVQAILNIALATVCIVALINLKIKISIHALISCTFALVMPLYLPAPSVILLPLFIAMWTLTVWSRRALNRHSTPELVLGTIAGVLVSGIYLFMT